jgi:hypothetical protein
MASDQARWRQFFHDAPPQVGDEQEGLWSPSRLLAMDRDFTRAVEHAFQNGDENREAASATFRANAPRLR